MSRRLGLTLALVAIAVPARAETLDLDALFNTAQVGIATRHVQSAREAPANVEVITDAEIRERGYTTVAEALRSLPGFYVVNDELLPSVGVRGISSGQRGWSRIIKVMIDGQPVPYRPDGSNWLGPELIPIGLVKRIEVIRGPASALYGADAFLGVVNVVTKRGADLDGLRLDALAGDRAGHPTERGQLNWATLPDANGVDWTFGALGGIADHSGLTLPDTSPNAATLTQNGQTTSAKDFAYPASAFARVGFTPHPGLAVSVDTDYQHLDSGGEFQDWAPLTHQNRLSEQNWYLRTQASQALNAAISLDGSLAYSRGGPAGGDQLSIGRTDYVVARQLLAQAWDATGDLNWALGDRSAVTFGGDWDRTMQNLPTYLELFPSGATQPDGESGGYAQLDNVGAYVQGIYYPLDELGITANLRDEQNSVYGNNLSSRLGLVYQVNAAVTAKALYGSSFKAPSAPELYGTPLIFGDILGNPNLKPERANTIEGLVTYAPDPGLSWTSDVYYTHVTDKVTFFTQNGNPYAVNLGQLDSAGIESGVDWRWRFLDGFFNTSLQKTVQTTSDGFADPNGEIEPYPYWMANAGVGSPVWHLPLNTFLEARYVGWVPSSQSNFVANGHEAYEIPPAFVVDWTLTSRDLYWNADKETIVSLKIENLFDTPYTQPGYGGVDYPGLGRTFWLDFSQGF